MNNCLYLNYYFLVFYNHIAPLKNNFSTSCVKWSGLIYLVFCAMTLVGQSNGVGTIPEDFYDPYKVRDIKVYFAQSDWAGVLDSVKRSGSKERILCSLVVDGIPYDSVGIRYKGNSSYFNVSKNEEEKLPFNIKLNQFVDHDLPGNYSKIKLSNIFRDPSFVREMLSYEIAGKYMPAPKVNFARLYINDEFHGFYNNVESIEKKFLKKRFDTKKGILFKCDPISWDIEPKDGCKKGDKASLMYLGSDPKCYEGYYELKSDDGGWDQLVNLTYALNEKPVLLDSVLNVDQALWMLAFNNVLVNLDSYTGRLCHNYYLYQDKKECFHPLVWDMNLSFGGFRFDGSGKPLSNEEMITLSPLVHFKNKERPLISVLLQNKRYRNQYIAHLRTIVEENFANGWYLNRAREIQQYIDYYVQSDENKLYSYEAFKRNLDSTTLAGKVEIIGISELMEGRTKYLLNHPIFSKTPPELSAPVHTIREEEMIEIRVQAKDALNVYLRYRKNDYSRFKELEMKDDGLSYDGAANDGVYGISIPYDDDLQYYFLAEKNDAAIFLPPRTSQDCFSVE